MVLTVGHMLAVHLCAICAHWCNVYPPRSCCMSLAQMSLMLRYGGVMTLARCKRLVLLYLVGAEVNRLRRSAQ